MKLTILDGLAAKPGDLDWNCFEPFGNLTVYSYTPAELVIKRSIDSEILFTNKVFFTKDVLRQLPKLRYIGVFATGYNQIDIEAATSRGITVTNIPNYCTDSVAQLTWSHLLNLTFRLSEHCECVRNGDWGRNPDFCHWYPSLTELAGLTFGIIGFGEIGHRVANIAEAFGMNVIAYSPSRESGTLVENVSFFDFEAVLQKSDVVSLHCPLKANNQKIINTKTISLMKSSAPFRSPSCGIVNQLFPNCNAIYFFSKICKYSSVLFAL
jgi:glycerate dehydrogenase